MNYAHTQEAMRDACEMERCSILRADDDALPEHQRADYAERVAEAADMRRKEQREDELMMGIDK